MECLCSKPKIYHITELKNGEIVELHLCEDCIQNYISSEQKPKEEEVTAVAEPEEKELTQEDIVKDLLKVFQLIVGKPSESSKPQPMNKPPCPACGITISEISKIGRLGCPNCYDYFGPELKNFLNATHGSLQHVGKVPSRYKKEKEGEIQFVPIEVLIKNLEIKMQKAVEKENYELAAELRDAIKELQQLKTNIDLLKIEFENKILNNGDSESVKMKMRQLMSVAMAIEKPFT